MNTLQLSRQNTEFSFYTTSRYFNSLIGQWTDKNRVSLKRHSYEDSLLNQITWKRPQVVIFGVEKSLLREGVISRLATSEHRPVIVSLIKSSNEEELTECYAQGADRVVAVPYCTGNIFRALLGRLSCNQHYYAPYLMCQDTQTFRFSEIEVRLRKKTFDVAQYLFVNHGKPIPKSKILHDVWGLDSRQCSTRRIEVHISQIRRMLQLDGTHDWEIRVSRGNGYGIFRTTRSVKHLSSTALPAIMSDSTQDYASLI